MPFIPAPRGGDEWHIVINGLNPEGIGIFVKAMILGL
jgi:hypothetical protein